MSIAVSALELPIGLQRGFAQEKELALGITALAAFVAGLISFTSPCGLVLFPTFFAALFRLKKKTLVMTAIFSLGLVVSFAILGLITGLAGGAFTEWKAQLSVASGIILIILGILFALNYSFPFPRFSSSPLLERTGAIDVFLLGIFFGIGWTPCNGAVLAGILFVGLNVSVLQSVILFSSFAVGVVVPLLVLAYAAERWNFRLSPKLFGREYQFRIGTKTFVTHTYNLVAGFTLVVIGIIMVSWQGTGFFMDKIPTILPWNMEFLANTNAAIVRSALFTSGLANLLGLFVVGLIIFLLFFLVRKKD